MKLELAFNSDQGTNKYIVNWDFQFIPRTGDLLWGMAYFFRENNIPEGIWGDYQITVETVYFCHDETEMYISLDLLCE